MRKTAKDPKVFKKLINFPASKISTADCTCDVCWQAKLLLNTCETGQICNYYFQYV